MVCVLGDVVRTWLEASLRETWILLGWKREKITTISASPLTLSSHLFVFFNTPFSTMHWTVQMRIYTLYTIYMHGCSCVIKEAIWLTGPTFTITYILLRLLVVVHFALVLLSWTYTHTHTCNINTLRDREGLWTYLGSVTAMFLSLARTLWFLVSPAPTVGLWQGRSMNNKGVKGRLCTSDVGENSIGGLTSYYHGSRHEQNWLRRPGHT